MTGDGAWLRDRADLRDPSPVTRHPEKAEGPRNAGPFQKYCEAWLAYIMPDMSGIPPPPPPSLSGISATMTSVVRMFFAIDAAFCSAERVTMAGSMMPAATRSTISPFSAFRP